MSQNRLYEKRALPINVLLMVPQPQGDRKLLNAPYLELRESMSQQTHWRNYEEVAQYLLGQMAAHFGLGRVEGKQLLAGVSGTASVNRREGCAGR